MMSNLAFSNRVLGALQLRAGEAVAVIWSCFYFFCLLSSYYLIRPLRDTMGIAGGVDKLQWLFTATFVVMLAAVPLYGWVVSRYPRDRFLPLVYGFFIVNLLVFFVLFSADLNHEWVARAFFVWVSVFNLFVVSVFWSFMNDVFSPEQATRLFPAIAAGGTAGALTGPAVTATLSLRLDPINLLLASAMLLGLAIVCVMRLSAWRGGAAAGQHSAHADSPAMGGTVWAGLTLVFRSPYLMGICVLMLLFTTLATFLYFQQAEIIRDAFSSRGERTAVFAAMDLVVNVLTLVTQVFITGRLVGRFGLALTLSLVPVALTFGFLALAVVPSLGVIVAVQVLRRAGNYALMRPAREMLYTVLDRESKYKAKSLIDTAVYRGGDAVSAWAYSGLSALGLGLAGIAWIAVPLGALWAFVAYRLGVHREALRTRMPARGPSAGYTPVSGVGS